MKGKFAHGFTWFVIGVVTGLAIAALTAILISTSPMPFEDKVDKVTADVDPSVALKGGVDPNAPLNSQAETQELSVSRVANVQANTPKSAAGENASRDSSGKALEPGEVSPVSYWVQVGAYSSEEDAKSKAAELAFTGMSSKIMKVNAKTFRLRVGPFEDKKAAEEVLTNLENQNFQPIIVEQR